MFSLICLWTNSSVNNRDAGELKGYGTHYDITVMVNLVKPPLPQPTQSHKRKKIEEKKHSQDHNKIK